MLNKRGLRFRISVTFLVLACFLSTLFAWAVSMVADRMEHHFVQATLTENLGFVVQERQKRPDWALPRTTTISAYAVPRDQTMTLPDYLRPLGPGVYEHEDGDRDYQIAVRDVGEVRYVVTYDDSGFDAVEDFLHLALALGVLVISFVGLWLGAWTADRIIAPLTNLTRQIRSLGDEVEARALDVQWGDDEVAELASAFEHYMFQVKELMRREREFTSNVSHELRTPIMVASSSVELLLSQPDLHEATQQQLARLQRAIRQMANLTDAFLILGRAESGDLTQTQSLVEPTLREVIEFRRESAQRKQLELNLTIEGNPSVCAPRTAVSVVLDNLVGNAVTYTDDGRVAVKLSDEGVTITDTGPGIPPDEQAKVFDREFRGRRAKPGGAGLGLSIVHALCDHYGWRVSLESIEGRGTIAHLQFSA